jgi:hypothetical protein
MAINDVGQDGNTVGSDTGYEGLKPLFGGAHWLRVERNNDIALRTSSARGKDPQLM